MRKGTPSRDFREDEPVWEMYAIYVGDGSDKFYEVRIDMDDDGTFWLTKRHGRRPDVGNGRLIFENYQTMHAAQVEANDIFNAKLLKGYRATPRPVGASHVISDRINDDEERTALEEVEDF